MASSGMMLRNMALVGKTSSTPMPPARKPMFEEGCAILFSKWTALQLAVANEWGGSSSKDKAQSLLAEVIHWFYTTKDLEPSDLEDLLDEAIQVDFNVQAEDDSPYQVARSLVNMHNQVAGGDDSYIQKLRESQPMGASHMEARPAVPGEDEGSSSSDDEEGSGSEDGGEAMDVDMEDAPAAAPQGPVVDEDGFQVVQRKGKGRR